MHLTRTCILRAATVAVAVFALGASASNACQRQFRGAFLTHHVEEEWAMIQPPGAPQPIPVPVKVDVAGTGWASHLSGPVISFTNNQDMDLSTGAMQATYTLRGRGGDTIVMELTMTSQEPSIEHDIVFSGNYTILRGTGRYTGVTGGEGTFKGWADLDDPPADSVTGLPECGPGYWEFCGTIVLPERPRHR